MEMFDLVGIGIGPFNLSLAALAEPTELRTIFLEMKSCFSWHPDFMLPNGQLQVSPLKDCVTLADPTSQYSFLNYLAVHRRLYSFINKRSTSTSRKEFTHYFQWVARQLSNLRFEEEVIDVAPIENGYHVKTTVRNYFARAIAIGVGVAPKIPECARPWLCDTVYHVADYLNKDDFNVGEHVIVVGGGQSGAEVIEHMLSNSFVGKITWVTSRSNLFAMDDNSFVNEAYTPSYSRRFHKQPIQQRREIVEDEKLTSDGISTDLSNRIYDRLYEHTICGALNDIIQISPSVVMECITRHNNGWSIELKSLTSQQRRKIVVDRVILATGFQPRTLPFIDKLLISARMDDGIPVIGDDYAVQFEYRMPGPVYLQNRSRIQHGLQSVSGVSSLIR